MDGCKARNALALKIFASYRMTRAFRRNHDNVDISRRLNLTKMNVEAVCKRKNLAGGHVRCDAFIINSRLLFVRKQNHDKICGFCSLRHGCNL